MPAAAVPPTYAADFVEPRSRLTTFFRIILAIPHFIVTGLWGFAAVLAVIVAWFAIVVTGRYPRGLYDFVAGFTRYSTATYAYVYLLTDVYPPFSGDTDGYPVRLRVGPPLEQYSRLKALFRIVLAIPVLIILYAMQIVAQVGAFLAWFAIVALGRQVKGLQDMINLGLSYEQRAAAYLYLLTEDWPPFQSPPESAAVGGGGPDPSGLPGSWSPPAPSTSPTPSAPGLSSGDPLAREVPDRT